MARAAIGFAIYLFLTPVVLFWSAGTMAWPEGWAFTALWVMSILVGRLLAWRRHPDLLRERAKAWRGGEETDVDRSLTTLAAILAPLVMVIVSGLDRRLVWGPGIPSGLRWAAGLGVAFGYGMGAWAMAVNPFFSAVARIQSDRDQRVITAGPYRWVRHPAYAGGVLSAVCMPLMLGSIWALLPSAIMIVMLIIRCVREDKLLADGLEGYRAYMARTPYRLLPRIW